MNGFGEMLVLSKSTSYTHLAQVYDRLMEEAPYDEWVQFAKTEWERYGHQPAKIIDLACGTGNISILLAEAGFHVTGIDLSEEMLCISQEKAQEKGLKLDLYQQDMREFISPEPVDSIVCFCDSLNYITSSAGVRQTFDQVYRALKPGGVFLFDVHSLYKIREVFGDHTFTLAEDEISYIWECECDGEDSVVHDLTIFVQEGHLYRRYDELHVQRGYAMEDILEWLKQSGFQEIHHYADFELEPPAETSERWFFSCKK